MMETNQVLYATLPRRIKASIIDGVVLLVLFILSPLIIGTLIGRDTGLSAIAMFTPPLLLEPFLISFLGFTLGQYMFGGTSGVRLDFWIFELYSANIMAYSLMSLSLRRFQRKFTSTRRKIPHR